MFCKIYRGQGSPSTVAVTFSFESGAFALMGWGIA
jgi:hypothetical protein